MFLFAILVAGMLAVEAMDLASQNRLIVFFGVVIWASALPLSQQPRLKVLIGEHPGGWVSVVFVNALLWTIVAFVSPAGLIIASAVIFGFVFLSVFLLSGKDIRG